jgi:hypothetical protein
MTNLDTQARLALKTPEAAFEHVLQQEFGFAPRIARALLHTAQEMLVGTTPAAGVQPGQIRQVVASLDAPFGPPLAETDKVTVTLTVDSGAEDAAVQAALGAEGVRRKRILRLTEEALAQHGVLTQEDLARALQVSARTIRRSVQALKREGHVVPTRGEVQGVGRGQTHKVKIITLWLDRTSYPQIMRQTYHSQASVRRYISTFLRMVVLQRRGWSQREISFLTRSSEHLVQEYLTLYEKAQQDPARAAKLEQELVRVSSNGAPAAAEAQKGGPR